MTIDNGITFFDWDNRLSVDGVINIGYYDDIILMKILFALMKIYR